jgi:hypothetical protein
LPLNGERRNSQFPRVRASAVSRWLAARGSKAHIGPRTTRLRTAPDYPVVRGISGSARGAVSSGATLASTGRAQVPYDATELPICGVVTNA